MVLPTHTQHPSVSHRPHGSSSFSPFQSPRAQRRAQTSTGGGAYTEGRALQSGTEQGLWVQGVASCREGGMGGSLHTCISLSSVLTPHGEGQPAQAHNVPRFLGDSESPALIAPQEKPPLRARGGPVGASGVVRGARGCVGSWASGHPGWRLFAHLVRSGPLTSAQSGPMYRVSDDVVVHLPCAVDANNAKDHEDHGPCVHQRPHGWLPAARVHAGVEAEGGREAGLGHCRGSHICMRRQGPASRGPTSLPACTFLTGHVEEAFGRAVGAGAEQAAGRRRAHAPVERRLVGLSKVHFPAEAKEPG